MINQTPAEPLKCPPATMKTPTESAGPQPSVPVTDENGQVPWVHSTNPGLRIKLMTAAAFCVFLMLVWSVQRSVCASEAAFGGFPDEAAHFIGGLLAHDYLANAAGSDPFQFAREYYIRIPYFALGVWPPLFYGMEGLWMAMFGSGRPSVLGMMAVSAALLSTLLFSVIRSRSNLWTALAGGAMFMFIPIVQWSSCLVMADLTCSALALVAIIFFAQYVERQRWRHALLFGISLGAALLTKNSTYFVLLVPPLAIFVSWRWDLARKPALWIAGALAVAIYTPWLVLSKRFLLLGIHGLALPGFFGIQRDYVIGLWNQTSFLLPLAAAGILLLLRDRSRRSAAVPLCMLAVFPATAIAIFAARVPVQARLMMVSYIAVIFFVAEFWSIVLPSRKTPAMAACLGIFAILNWMHFNPPPENNIRGIVQFIDSRDSAGSGAVLVPSDREGPWIAEFAQREQIRPRRMIVRPTKLFGEENWNGSNWLPYYKSPDQVAELFTRVPVKYCILSSSRSKSYPHDDFLDLVVAANPASWHLVFSTTAYTVYENVRWQPRSEQQVEAHMRSALAKYLR